MKTHRKQRGQAMVEFALLATTVVILIFGILDIGRYLSLQLRLSSAVREAGRLVITNGLLPKDGAEVDYDFIDNQVNLLVFENVKKMVSPSGFDGVGTNVKGILYISYLKRNDNGNSNAPADVEILVERVFSYGNWYNPDGSAGIKPSPMYAQGTKFKGTDSNRLIDPVALNVGERTVLVEIFHPLTFTNIARQLLKNTTWNKIHEYAVF